MDNKVGEMHPLLDTTKRNTPLLWTQVVATFSLNLLSLTAGAANGFSGACLHEIRNDPMTLATEEQGSWVASLNFLGGLGGCLIATCVADKLGRRGITIIGSAPVALGWALIAFAHSLHMVYAGRFAVGFGIGLASANKQVYISEVTEVRHRGFLSSLTSVCLTSGTLILYVFGPIVHWRIIAGICIAFPTLCMILTIIFLRESPSWLVSKNRFSDAEESLRFIRGKYFDIGPELEAILKHHAAVQNRKLSLNDRFDLFVRTSLKPFLILIMVFFTHKFSGSPAITAYTWDVFESVGIQGISEHAAMIITGTVRVIFTMFGSICVRYVKKKLLLFGSGMGMAASVITFATYNYLDTSHIQATGEPLPYSWIYAVSVWSFMAFVTPGFLSVPWVLLGELFPLEIRGTLSSLATAMNYFWHFLSVKTYPCLKNNVGEYGSFWIYGGITMLGTTFAVLMIPETKGKTLTEIEQEFEKVKPKKNNKKINPI